MRFTSRGRGRSLLAALAPGRALNPVAAAPAQVRAEKDGLHLYRWRGRVVAHETEPVGPGRQMRIVTDGR